MQQTKIDVQQRPNNCSHAKFTLTFSGHSAEELATKTHSTEETETVGAVLRIDIAAGADAAYDVSPWTYNQKEKEHLILNAELTLGDPFMTSCDAGREQLLIDAVLKDAVKPFSKA